MHKHVAVLNRKIPLGNLLECSSFLKVKLEVNFVGRPGRPISDSLESQYSGWKVLGYYRQEKDKAS
jgi:hypothetical protein